MIRPFSKDEQFHWTGSNIGTIFIMELIKVIRGPPYRYGARYSNMELRISEESLKLRWILMYSIWAFVELLSIAAFGYSIYSVIILIYGNWAGAAVFAGIIPGFVLFIASLYIYMLARVPWHKSDYQSSPCFDYQVRQVRLFHTILWSDESSEALPHAEINLHALDPIGKKDEFLVYHHHGCSGYRFYEQRRWLAYAWAILCELFVFAVFFLSVWFIIWAGLEASVSFLSGAFLFSIGTGIFCFYHFKKGNLLSGQIVVAGLTWVIVKDQDTLHLRHFFCMS